MTAIVSAKLEWPPFRVSKLILLERVYFFRRANTMKGLTMQWIQAYWRTVALMVAPVMTQLLSATDHGPVFGLATPTNPRGGWSVDIGVNGRGSASSTLEAELT